MALKQFAVKARPLPVIVLADTSGSMSVDGKIEALNAALKDMIATFADESRQYAEIQLLLVTFGGSQAAVHQPLSPVQEIGELQNLEAWGRRQWAVPLNWLQRYLKTVSRFHLRRTGQHWCYFRTVTPQTIGKRASSHSGLRTERPRLPDLQWLLVLVRMKRC